MRCEWLFNLPKFLPTGCAAFQNRVAFLSLTPCHPIPVQLAHIRFYVKIIRAMPLSLHPACHLSCPPRATTTARIASKMCPLDALLPPPLLLLKNPTSFLVFRILKHAGSRLSKLETESRGGRRERCDCCRIFQTNRGRNCETET